MKKSNLASIGALALLPLVWGCVHVHESEQVAVPPPPPAPVLPPAPQTPALSPMAAEVVKLAEAGSSNEVMLAYIQNARAPFNLGAEQILYIQDLGVAPEIVTAMLNRDNELRSAPPPASPLPPVVVTPPLAPPAEPPPVYVSTPPAAVTYFYSDLAPYGAWIQLEGIGWCWQPHVVAVNPAWRPYCDAGHWLYTDAGWYWQSDYSWGWAPFHYGRWQLHPRCGWVWLPDRVWGPAWVVWRSQGDYCGWAALPPHAEFDARSGWRYNGVHVGITFDFGLHADHFTFIAMRDFHDHDYVHRRLPPTEVTRVYNNTTIINNYTVVNNTVVNNGIHVDRVATATRTEIKKVPLRDAPAEMRSQPDEKKDLVAYRHEVKAPARPVKMVAQKLDEQHPVVQHTAAVAPASPKTPAGTRANPGVGNRRPEAESGSRQPATAAGTGRQYPAPKAAAPAAAGPAATRSAEPPKAVERPKPVRPSPVPTAAAAQETKKPAPPAQPVSPQPTDRRNATDTSKKRPANQAAAKSRPAAKGPQLYEPKSYHQAQEAKILPSDKPQAQDNSGQGQRRKNEQ